VEKRLQMDVGVSLRLFFQGLCFHAKPAKEKITLRDSVVISRKNEGHLCAHFLCVLCEKQYHSREVRKEKTYFIFLRFISR
jgi:hypothetical protein